MTGVKTNPILRSLVIRQISLPTLEPLQCSTVSSFCTGSINCKLIIPNSPNENSAQGIYCFFYQQAVSIESEASITEYFHVSALLFQLCLIITNSLQILWIHIVKLQHNFRPFLISLPFLISFYLCQSLLFTSNIYSENFPIICYLHSFSS